MNKPNVLFKTILIAALVILIMVTGIYLFKKNNQSEQAASNNNNNSSSSSSSFARDNNLNNLNNNNSTNTAANINLSLSANSSTSKTALNTKPLPIKTLIIGTASGYAPFVSVNENGDYEGFDIDVAHALAKQLNMTLEIRDLGSMAPLFMALEQGSIDAIIWGISITQDRLKKVALIRYWGDDTKSFPMIFWDKIPANIKSINDMQNLTVCVEPASAQDNFLGKYNFIDRKFTEKIDDALLNIQYHKANAALVEPAIALKFQRKYPQVKILEIPLAPEDQIQGMGIVVKKNNLELITQIKQAVQNLTKSGEIKKFANQWGI